jgi:hypothetical protein
MFLPAVLTLSEVAGSDTTQRTAETNLHHYASGSLRPSTPPSAALFLDVDAFDNSDDNATQAAPPRMNLSNGNNSSSSSSIDVTAVGVSAAVAPVYSTVPVGRNAQVRDAVVLSYRDGLFDATNTTTTEGTDCYDICNTALGDEMLAIAVDDSRIFFRQGGRVKALRSSVMRPNCPLPVLRAGVSRGNEADESEEHTCSNTTSSSSPSSSIRAAARTMECVPLFTTQWRQDSSTHLAHVQAHLFRVRPHGGAQSSLIFPCSSNNASGRYGCEGSFVALSSAAVSLVRARDGGAALTPLQLVTFDREAAVNATCMDDWGPHGSVVGFSDGTLRVVDWRAPCPRPPWSTSSFSTSSSAGEPEGSVNHTGHLSVRVPQPQWLSKRRRSGLVWTSVAGVLSCCALEDSFRVVCGLGDASGTVVVADLRKPDAPVGHKRGRRSRMETQIDALFCGVGEQTPTGRAVTDICRSTRSFGEVGLVDVAGTAVLTHISVLEGTREATRMSFAVQRGKDTGGAMALNSDDTAASSPSSAFTGQPHRGSRIPTLPPPWQVIARAERMAPPIRVATATTTSSMSVDDIPRTPLRVDGPFHPRCTFTSGGRYLVHTEPGACAVCATLQHLPHTGGLKGMRLRASSTLCHSTRLQLSMPAASNSRASGSTVVAVSSVDQLVCFDTDNGNTLSLFLYP